MRHRGALDKKYVPLDISIYFVYCPTVQSAFLYKVDTVTIKTFSPFRKQANVTGNVHIY